MNDRHAKPETPWILRWLFLCLALCVGCWSVPRNPNRTDEPVPPGSSSLKSPTAPRSPATTKTAPNGTSQPATPSAAQNAAQSATPNSQQAASTRPATANRPTVAKTNATPGSVATANTVAPARATATRATATSTAAVAAAKPADDSAAKKPAVAASVSLSDQRQGRLGDVARDFDTRRDEAQYQAALNRWREDDAAGCRQQLDILLARNPELHKARILLAEVALSQSAVPLALEQSRKVLAAEPNNAQAHHLMALSLDALGEPAAALQHYERAAKLAPNVEAYSVAYQAALDATVLPAASRGKSPASSGNAAAAAANPNRATIVSQASYFPADDAPDASLDPRLNEYRQRIQHDPDNQQLVLTASVFAMRNGRPAVAIEFATVALARTPDSAPLLRVIGAAQCQVGNLRAAQVSLSKALSLDKSDPLAYFLMGTTLARLGEADAATRHFAEAARLDPRYGQNRN